MVKAILMESIRLMEEMAPYLLFGFLFAGILKVFLPQEKVVRFLGKGKIKSVFNASLLGIPLPLCSCGVIPAAVSLHKQGANKGATLSFLISTPTTGIDSILATYGLLGAVFTVFRVITSFIGAVVCGSIVNLLFPPSKAPSLSTTSVVCSACGEEGEHSHSLIEKMGLILRYAFFDLVEDIGRWLLIGILLGGIISYAAPPSLISAYLGPGFMPMIIMLLVGIPLYVCATGSIPIAAALMLKGMSPGAALVFLLCGPATNTVTLTVIAREIGKKEVIIYLTSIVFSALTAGFVLNHIWHPGELKYVAASAMLPLWVKKTSTILLAFLLARSFIVKLVRPHKEKEVKEIMGEKLVIKIPDMNCMHCVRSIKEALSSIDITEVNINLGEKKVTLDASLASREEEILKCIRGAGFSGYVEE